MERSKQKAGDYSTLIQAENININNGITEQRAKEIFEQEMQNIISSHTPEIIELVTKRVMSLFADLMQRIRICEKSLNAFSDPSFMRNVGLAQLTAAVSDREEDINILSELLLSRMNNTIQRQMQTGIRKAIEIVNEIDKEELMALSVILFNDCFRLSNVLGADLDCYINYLSDSFEKIVKNGLPQGRKWIKHLAVLDAILIDHTKSFMPFVNTISKKATGFVCLGIEKESQEYEKAISLLSNCELPENLLVDNELMPGFVRLPVTDLHDVSFLPILYKQHVLGKLDDRSQRILKEIISLYQKNDNQLKDVEELFIKKILQCNTIRRINEWFSSFENAFELTSIGTALAYANVRHHIPNLPVIDIDKLG